MLSQFRKGWQNIGISSSQKMLDSALSKLRVFMNSPDVLITDKVQYVDLSQKINSFKEDVTLICEAVKARQKKPKIVHGFVSAGKIRI